MSVSMDVHDVDVRLGLCGDHSHKHGSGRYTTMHLSDELKVTLHFDDAQKARDLENAIKVLERK